MFLFRFLIYFIGLSRCSLDSGLGSVFSGAFGALGAIGGSLINRKAQRETNEQNKKLQYMQWAREDTAVQRQVADSLNAGVSPIGNVNGSPSTLSTSMVAPTLDTATVVDTMRSLGDAFNAQAMREHETDEKQKDRDFQAQLTDKQLSHSLQVVDMQLKSAESIEDKRLLESKRSSLATLQELQYVHDVENQNRLVEHLKQEVSAITGGKSMEFDDHFDDYDSYLQARSIWADRYAMELLKHSPYSSESAGESSSASTSAGGAVPGVSANATSSQGSASSGSYTVNESRDHDELAIWLSKNPCPVWKGKFPKQSRK